MEQRFAGKVALVTGGSNGLGRAITQSFIAEGARVVVLDLAESTALAHDDRIMTIIGDVANPETGQHAVARVLERWGRLDILVNDAAAYPNGTVVEMPYDEWRRVFDVNVGGTFLLCQAFARHCLSQSDGDGDGAGTSARGARIVNISSGAARRPRPAGGAYCASKSAIETLTKVLAMELGPHGVTVNAVAPGYIDVRGQSDCFPDRASDERRTALVRSIPLGEAGQPDDIARAVLFLCSDAACHVSGTTLDVDGGSLAGRFVPSH